MGDHDLDGSRHADPLPKPSTCFGGDQMPDDHVVLRPGEHGSIVGDDRAWLAAPRAGLRSRCRGSPPGTPPSHHRQRSGCGIAGRRHTGHGRKSTDHRPFRLNSTRIGARDPTARLRARRRAAARPSSRKGREMPLMPEGRPRAATGRTADDIQRFLVGEIAQLCPSGRHER
jgi:hypothetical protein